MNIRCLATLALFVSASLSFGQSTSTSNPAKVPTDAPEVKAKAQASADKIFATTTLDDAQKAKVYDLYLRRERQAKAIEMRAAASPQAGGAIAKDQDTNNARWDDYMDGELKRIMGDEQFSRWEKASAKKE
jgi:hypothetical protein